VGKGNINLGYCGIQHITRAVDDISNLKCNPKSIITQEISVNKCVALYDVYTNHSLTSETFSMYLSVGNF